jgi:sugar phosphate isomerase/epimerase
VNQDLSLSVAGVRDHADARAAIEWVASLGYRAIQLDATMPGLRPRELDRSARRGVASTMRRLGLVFSGLDLWIPPEHFADPARQERAVDAVTAAIQFAADLRDGPLAPVSVAFPPQGADAGINHVRSTAARIGVPIAAFGEIVHQDEDPIGAGIDPAAILAAGGSVTAEVSNAARVLASARLSDWKGSRRIVPGSGTLDVGAYRVALSIAGRPRHIVVDLRDLDDLESAARRARQAWDGSL